MNEENKTNEVVATNKLKFDDGITAGKMLKQARTTGRGKRNLATISKVLRIREEYLEALEEENYKVIPELVYILGFARNYAMELGLEPGIIIEKLKEELGVNDIISDEEAPAFDSMPSEKKEDTFTRFMRFIKRNNKIVLILSGVALVLIIIAILASALSSDKSDEVVDNRNNIQIVEVLPEPKFEITYNLPIAKEYGIENREDANIVIQAEKESWVKVVNASGDNLFSLVLLPGDVYYVPVGDKIMATIGNAGGVDIWVDGKQIPKIGKLNVRASDILMTAENLLSLSK